MSEPDQTCPVCGWIGTTEPRGTEEFYEELCPECGYLFDED